MISILQKIIIRGAIHESEIPTQDQTSHPTEQESFIIEKRIIKSLFQVFL